MEEINKTSAIVLYPSPGIGHLVSMVELGKLIISRHPNSISHIIILITTASHLNNSATFPYISHVSATTPSITFRHLPTIPLPPKIDNDEICIEMLNFELQTLNKTNIRLALEAVSSKPLKIEALVMDFFCSPAFEVCSEILRIPTYYFYTSGASTLSPFLYLPTTSRTTKKSYKDLSAFIEFPGLPPVFSSDLSKTIQDRNKVVYTYFLETAVEMAKSAGIIINTFHSLEPRAITAISDGLCIPDAPTPPIYCIGPLTAASQTSSDAPHECLIWLNSQPSKSVVFLCFGSHGVFEEKQLKEIAVGLENSSHRFLWVVRNPPTDDEDTKTLLGPQEPDLDVLLPQGFLERNKGRGLVVKLWAPQVAVLNHDSIGGFVTHCGWNSILEGVCAGVPMIGWPLYAEQRINRVILVEELKLGLGLDECGGQRFVSSAELEKRVRELMDSDKGERVRHRVGEMKDAAKVAMDDKDGSSCIALASLVAKWKA